MVDIVKFCGICQDVMPQDNRNNSHNLKMSMDLLICDSQDTYNPFIAEASRVLKRITENTPQDDHAEAIQGEKEVPESEGHATDADNVEQSEKESRPDEPTCKRIKSRAK